MPPRSLPILGRLAGAVVALCLVPASAARADRSDTVHVSAAEVCGCCSSPATSGGSTQSERDRRDRAGEGAAAALSRRRRAPARDRGARDRRAPSRAGAAGAARPPRRSRSSRAISACSPSWRRCGDRTRRPGRAGGDRGRRPGADGVLEERASARGRVQRRGRCPVDTAVWQLRAGRDAEQTVRLASSNARFAGARDALWAGAAHQRVTDDADALVAGNPVLATTASATCSRAATPTGA